MDTNQTLTNKLSLAASSLRKEDIEDFLTTLSQSKVYFASRLVRLESMHIVGDKDRASTPFLMSEDGTLAVFSEESFLLAWAEKEFQIGEDTFKQLLWKLPPNSHIHLNPNQDVGKIFTPVEIELFKNGEFDELIELIQQDEVDEFEILDLEPEFFELKSAILPVLTIYDELEEAYLLTIKESSSNSKRALVGIKYDESITAEKISYIRSEIERTAKEFLISPFTGIFIVDDLHHVQSPNQTLFIDFEPFYIKK